MIRTCTASVLAALIGLAGATAARAAAPLVADPRAVVDTTGATRTSAAPADREMTVALGLARPDPAGEQALLQAQQDPASPDYRRFLTPAQFAQRFGVPQARVDDARAFLAAGGLSVAPVKGAGDYVLARGTAAQVQRAFHVTLGAYARGAQRFVAPDSAPSVPAGIGVTDVLGLDTLHRATPAGTGAGAPQLGLLTPQDLWSIYHQPADHTGRGQKVAVMIMGRADTVERDLRSFEAKYELPQTKVRVVPAVANGDYSDDSGHGEWIIDTQAAQGMAPDLDEVTLYAGQTLTDVDQEAAFSAWANDPDGPLQADASFGECETTPANAVLEQPAIDPLNASNHPDVLFGTNAPNMVEPVAEPTFRQAVMEGRTMFASTGDTGSSCPALVATGVGAGNGVANQGVPLVNYPAASPYVTAVGGTVTYKDSSTPPQRALEYAWPFTGGGQSFFLTEPEYQKSQAAVNRPCVSTPDGQTTNTGQTCRGIPDVAALSGDVISQGYTIVDDGKDSQGGGTSLSSPLWMGMWARIQSAAPDQTTGNGFANAALYRVAADPAKEARDFFDVTVGGNGAYTAGQGWDYVSGFGVPDVSALLPDVVAQTKLTGPATTTGRVTAPGAAPGGTATATCTDRTAPVARVLHRAGEHVGFRVLMVKGTVTDAGCGPRGRGKVAFVAVSVARRVGTRCAFVTPRGRLAKAGSCAKLVVLPTRRSAGRFSVSLGVHLPKGHYLTLIQATDAAGNVQRARRAFARLPRLPRK